MNKTFNIEDMENVANAINTTRKVVDTNTEYIVAPIRDYCLGIRKWIEDEKDKMVGFINRHSDIFYKFNSDEKYYSHTIKSENYRNWDSKRTSVYIKNIEITVDPVTGIANNIELGLDFQYNHKICNYRNSRHNRYIDVNCTNYTIDFWTDTKKGFDELKEEFSILIDEFTKCIQSIQNEEINKVKDVIKTRKEVEEDENPLLTFEKTML